MSISSEKPSSVIEHLEQEGINVIQEKEWLLRCRIGTLDTIIIICRLLPLEEQYYYFLLFAPVNSQKWKEFVKIVIEKDRYDLLTYLKLLKPKEVNMMLADINLDLLWTPKK